jgi:long-chain fatty acid transport protein
VKRTSPPLSKPLPLRGWGRFLFVAFGTMFVPSIALGGGFEVPDQSAVAGGTGGASTARSDDPAAAWYNPAALADGGGFRGAFSLTLAMPTITAESTNEPSEGAPTATELNVGTPVALHLSYADDAWAFGTYAGISHGSGVSWPEGWWGRFDAISSNVRVFRIAPFFAYRIPDAMNFTIAAGVHVDIGSLEDERALDMIDYQGRSHLLLWGAGVGGHGSLYIEPIEELAIGFTYKSRTYIRMDGDADFTVPDAFATRAPDQRAATDFWIPDRFSLGAALRLDQFRAYADLGLSLWSVRDRQVIELESDASPDVVQDFRWRDAVDVRAGVEYQLIPEVTIRGGIRYEMAAAIADTLSPSSPDLDRFGITLGASFDPIPELGLDVQYGYTVLLAGESLSQDAPPARYSGDAHFVGISARVEYDPTRPAPVVEQPEPEVEADPAPEVDAEPEVEADIEPDVEADLEE